MEDETYDNYYNLLEDNPILKRITGNKVLYYFLDRKKLKTLINEVALTLVLESKGQIVDRAKMEKRTGVKSLRYLDIKSKLIPKKIPKQRRQHFEGDAATDYFSDHLSTAVADGIEDLLIETVLIFLTQPTEKGRYILGIPEIEAFNALFKIRNKYQKEKIKLLKTLGDSLYWTFEKRQKFLKAYLKLSPSTTKAKRKYRELLKIKVTDPKKEIKDQYPELPAEILKKIFKNEAQVSPQRMVLEYLSPSFNRTSIGYMAKMLPLAKAEAQEKANNE